VKGLPIARWLLQHGYDVKVLTGFPQYPVGRIYPGYRMRWRQWEKMDGVPVLRVPIIPSHDLSAVRRMLTLFSFAFFAVAAGFPKIGRAGFVFVYDNTPTTGSVAWLYAWLCGAKIVTHVADLWPDTVLTSGMLRPRWLERCAIWIIGRWMEVLYRASAVVTVLSPGFKRILIERGVPASKIELVYNSAEEDKFFPTSPDPTLAAELGIDLSRFNVIYAGNMGPMQALGTVVHAACRLADSPSIRVVFVGSGPASTSIKALSRELGVRNIQFIEHQSLDRMNAINALAGALLIHLKDEPFLHATIPSKTQTSLVCGKPILVGVKGDAARLVTEAGAGYAFEPENADSMADAIRRMAALGPEEREAMGQAGRRYYLENLSTESGARQMDAIIRRIG
jgi:glycosyltransferase involved in cell wall biosynthesis